ncbi:MAG: hypothetical protein ABSG36_06400, partial [Acidimicrobiales bacterium]
VYWIDGCYRLVFKVDRIEVTVPGAFLPAPKGGIGVALITCWPTDALFWTPDRLVVLAHFVDGQSAKAQPVARTLPLGVSVSAPAALVAHGLGLEQNGILVGHLHLAGEPARTWAEGADPLRAAGVAFEELAAAKLAVEVANRTWWSKVALSGVTMPASLSTSDDFDVTVTAYGTRLTAVTLVSPTATVDLVVRSGKLYVSRTEQ